MDRVIVVSDKCVGCGVCRHACKNDALKLIPREDFPGYNGKYQYGDIMGRKVQTKKLRKPKKVKRTKIRIDYSICGEDGKIDPRDC